MSRTPSQIAARRGLAALLGLAIATCAAHKVAAAESLFVALDYDAGASPAGCPSALDFQRAVEHQLGYDPFRDGADKRMVVRIDATSRGLEGRVEWRSANGDWEGERKVSSHGRDCATLARAMTFAITVQIQLLATTLPSPSSQPSSPSTRIQETPRSPSVAGTVVEPAPSRPEEPEISSRVVAKPLVAEPAPVPARQSLLAIGVGLGPSAGLGLGPSPTFDGSLFASLRFDRISVELGAKGAWPSTLRQSDGSGFTQYRFALTAAGCSHLDRWSACVLGDVGQTRVRGFGVDAPRSSSGTTAMAGLRLALTQNVTHHFLVRAHADALGVLTPWTVTLNRTDVWTVPTLAAAIGIDLAVRFQ